MLDGNHYEILKKEYTKYGLLYESQQDTREAFEALLESVGMILRHHEYEIAAMADWYQEQEFKIQEEQRRIKSSIRRTA